MKKLFVLICIVTLISCQKSKDTVTESASPAFENEREAFFASLMKPDDTAAGLQATAAEFNGSLLNDPAKAESYGADSVKAAANMGVYLADLNYCIAYKQTDKIKELLPAALSLSKSIGIEQSILEFLTKRYNENIAQNDSVKAVIADFYSKSTKDLIGTDREDLVGITMSAYQIENLHLALGILESYPKDMLPDDARTLILVPVFRLALDQKENVEIIYGFLKSIADPAKNPNYAYYATAFQDLIAVYQKLDVDGKMANNQGLELMNDAVVKELREKVDAIRDQVIQ